ncbi:JAB domain-containing protein [Deminuibacter soli]|nr:JAB domain-containing protein [Deminuibacter soli]
MEVPKLVNEIKLTYTPRKLKRWSYINASATANSILRSWFPEKTINVQETFVALFLNAQNEVIGVHTFATGGVSWVNVDLRLIMAVALKSLAVSIIVAHNHPSGNLQPSEADKDFTKRIKEAAGLFQIRLLDHLIVVEGGVFLSMCDAGYL